MAGGAHANRGRPDGHRVRARQTKTLKKDKSMLIDKNEIQTRPGTQRQPEGGRRYQAFTSTLRQPSAGSSEASQGEAGGGIKAALSGASQEFARNQRQPNGE